jgi:hypothetical protein
VVRRPQQALEQRRVDRVRAEVAHVAPFGNGTVNAGDLGVLEAVGIGVGHDGVRGLAKE